MVKKAQMEIMGLAIVVVLLILGMLFAVKFVLFKPQQTYRKEYTTTQLAANTLNTLLNTHTTCNRMSVSELLQDASKDTYNINDCGSPTDPQNSQEFVSELIINLTNTTIKETLKRDYYFKASVPGKVVVKTGQESSTKERERKTHFLQTDVGVMTIVLDIYQ